MIRAVLIDDEQPSREGLRNLLEQFCTGVEVAALAEDVPSGVAAIIRHQPDVVFLDIEMPRQNGFELFRYFEAPAFEVIFTTAYDQYALRAFRLSALDYLLKPIDLEELRASIRKLQARKREPASPAQLEVLSSNLQTGARRRIALPTLEGFVFCRTDEIIRCEADNNYTRFFRSGAAPMLVSRTLKEFEDLLLDQGFFRAHRSHLINLEFVTRYTRAKMPVITMADGIDIPLAGNKRDEFLQLMTGRRG